MPKPLTKSRFFPLFSNHIYELCDDLPSIITSTKSVLKDFEADGVVYLELRTTPRAIPNRNITKELYVQTILDCICEFEAESIRQTQVTPMRTRLILSIDRRNSAQEAMDVVRLAVKYKDHGVVGVDLCGDPSKGDVSIFVPAFAEARNNGLALTIHFAEVPASSATDDLQCLLDCLPDRLGHVIHVNDELKQTIEQRMLGLELCLSCNVLAKMTEGGFAKHHFDYWRNTACPVALSV